MKGIIGTGYHFSTRFLLAIFLLNLIVIIPVLAQPNDSIKAYEGRNRPRFDITVNAIYAFMETNLRFESSNGFLGARINFEDHLGLTKSQVMPMISTVFNIKNRANIIAYYYGIPRKSYYTTKNEFDYNGEVIEAGTEIRAHFNTNVYSIGYMHDVFVDTKSRLGLFINFYVLTFNTGISSNNELIDQSFRIAAPLPHIGVMTSYKLHPKIGLTGLFSFFFLSVGKFGGSIHTLGAQVDFDLTRWLDLGCGYYLFDLNLEAETTNFTGLFDFMYQGPYLSLGFRF